MKIFAVHSTSKNTKQFYFILFSFFYQGFFQILFFFSLHFTFACIDRNERSWFSEQTPKCVFIKNSPSRNSRSPSTAYLYVFYFFFFILSQFFRTSLSVCMCVFFVCFSILFLWLPLHFWYTPFAIVFFFRINFSHLIIRHWGSSRCDRRSLKSLFTIGNNSWYIVNK